jgi:hypothetical protein
MEKEKVGSGLYPVAIDSRGSGCMECTTSWTGCPSATCPDAAL